MSELYRQKDQKSVILHKKEDEMHAIFVIWQKKVVNLSLIIIYCESKI